MAHALATTTPASALAQVDQALELAQRLWQRRDQAYHQTVTVWYKSWFPRER